MDELIIGSYEGFLLGYVLQSEDTGKKLKQTFATHSHQASIRCVSVGGKFLASGGTDDKVVVIDLKTRKEHTVLMNHVGTINAVAFTHSGTHLLTASDDGTIVVTRTGNWQIEKVWAKAHGGLAVTTIAVHPSDKLALSIGGDKTLRTWNLIKGRPAFTINLASKGILQATEIKFSPGGDRFSIVSQQMVDIWTISKAGAEKRLTWKSKPITVQWIDNERICVGLENGNIINLTVTDTKAVTYAAHNKQRVKGLYYEDNKLYSASSSGQLKVWAVDGPELSEICSCHATCRATCIAMNKQNHLVKKEESDQELDIPETVVNDDINNDSDDAETEVTKVPQKRKPGAFVTISFGDDDASNAAPPPKKFKKRNRNKKNKNKKQVENKT